MRYAVEIVILMLPSGSKTFIDLNCFMYQVVCIKWYVSGGNANF